ncbi:MAG: hypothetical protein DYH17_09610, partial [Xanthomonadales bacterium PRO6]|nr:hypothetical protein [Xanthomonadales bacterium PRO6]
MRGARGPRGLLFGAVALGAAMALWLSSPRPPQAPRAADGATRSGAQSAAGAASSGTATDHGIAASPVSWELLLRADAGVRARPDSVRVGLATVPA